MIRVTRLDGKETVFGQVVSGMELLSALGERLPCFGRDPSDVFLCQVESELPAPLIIRHVVIEVT
jgi:cyclophilin family peptidyl-prolyl cis-trans isomerase